MRPSSARPSTAASATSTLVGDSPAYEKAFVPLEATPALSQPAPTPAGALTRPNARQFDLRNLARIPSRLLHPPKSSSSTGANGLSHIHLKDVLNNKHLSPLSLRDFEGYLAHKELSAENLYFALWLAEYTKEWTALQTDKARKPSATQQTRPGSATTEVAQLPAYLINSLHLGLDSFFSPNSPLELNLSDKVRDATCAGASLTGRPSEFDLASDEITRSLERSLEGFKRMVTSNAGFRKLGFCFAMGCTVFLLGLLPSILAIAFNKSRWFHIIGFPFLLMGSAAASMAPQGICAAVWFLGADRQLYPWERQPLVRSASLVALANSTQSSNNTAPGSPSASELEQGSTHSANSAQACPWESFDDQSSTARHSVVNMNYPPQNLPPAYSKAAEASTESIPMWQPVTRVLSNDVAREHWRVVRKGFFIGFAVMCVVGGSLLAVPV